MKIILISILSIALSISLFARLNPFEPTNQFLEEKALILKSQIQDDEKFEVLPFVNIQVQDDVLTIKVDPKYKLLNKDLLIPANKIVFDFEGNISFYTIRKDIHNSHFNSFKIGTHMEDNFFRIVIDLAKAKTNYLKRVDSKNGIISIKKK